MTPSQERKIVDTVTKRVLTVLNLNNGTRIRKKDDSVKRRMYVKQLLKQK